MVVLILLEDTNYVVLELCKQGFDIRIRDHRAANTPQKSGEEQTLESERMNAEFDNKFSDEGRESTVLAYRLQLVVVGRLVNKLSEKLCLVLPCGRPHGCNLLHRVWEMGEEVKITRR